MVATIFQNGHKSPRVPTLPHQQKAQSHRQKVKDLLPNRIVGCSPDLARMVGGATTGLFLSQLLFLSDKGANLEGLSGHKPYPLKKVSQYKMGSSAFLVSGG
jgi:hypothetical protein